MKRSQLETAITVATGHQLSQALLGPVQKIITVNAEQAAVSYTHLDVYKRQV